VPRWTPPFHADAVAAWEGVFAAEPKVPIRIEAAAYGGKPVWFVVAAPWTPPIRSLPPPLGKIADVSFAAVSVFFVMSFAVGAMFAHRNVRSGRGDRRGAFRLVAALGTMWMMSWMFVEHHLPNVLETLLAAKATAGMLFMAAIVWTSYIALEPFVRRRWPHVLVSWTRVLAAEWRDPQLGRDVLIGCVAAGAVEVMGLSPFWFGQGLLWAGIDPGTLSGTAHTASRVIDAFGGAVFIELVVLFALVFLSVLLRSRWVAGAVLAVVLSIAIGNAPNLAPLLASLAVIAAAIELLVLIRFGLVAAIVMQVAVRLISGFPITFDMSAWYAGYGLAALLVLLALVGYGFRTSLGGRRVFELADI
jgi:serine/threonine-protein kinase